MSKALVTLENVSKTYPNGTIALEDVNLTIKAGEFISLLGPSGCGKSTVLRILADLGKVSQGNIYWAENHNKNDLAFVFQEAALMPWATVLENIRLPLKLSGVKNRTSRIQSGEVINLVGLEGFENVYPRQLSGGMKMRVSIARALVTQPRLILMDEPFAALDDITRTRLNEDLLRLWQQINCTVIFVTHNITEAVFLSQRIMVMKSRPGKIINEISIEAPYPRSEDFRTSRLCNQYCRDISDSLRAAAIAG